jgi:Na+-driven multidrug efflux pump
MRIVGFVGARALQGTGDTRTPMLVNGSATGLNILLSVTLGLGVRVLCDSGSSASGILRGDWMDLAARMIAERGSDDGE